MVDGSTGWAPEGLERLSQEQVCVLAALSRAPLGLTPNALASTTDLPAADLVPVVASLADAGLVVEEERRVVEGRVKTLTIVSAEVTHPDWHRIAPYLAAIKPPEPLRQPLPARVPDHLSHLFWNADLNDVQLPRDAAYVARRILLCDDPEGWAWAAKCLPAYAWEEAAGGRGIDRVRAGVARTLAINAGIQ